MDKIIPIFQNLRTGRVALKCPEIEDGARHGDMWVVLEKDRYIRQRLNSKIALRNFQRIESIKEELIRELINQRMSKFLLHAEFGFDLELISHLL